MANHKSAKKAHRLHEVRRLRNRDLKTRLRHVLKTTRAAADAADGETAELKTQLRTTVALIDTLVHKGIINRNAAARYKSRLVSRARKPPVSAAA